MKGRKNNNNKEVPQMSSSPPIPIPIPIPKPSARGGERNNRDKDNERPGSAGQGYGYGYGLGRTPPTPSSIGSLSPHANHPHLLNLGQNNHYTNNTNNNNITNTNTTHISNSQASSSASSSRVIGNYVALKRIGQGSFATVLLGQHRLNPSHYVAIKSIRLSKLQSNRKLIENLESEIKIMLSIQHPSIMRLFDLYRTENHIYLILEYCSGGDLSRFLRRSGPLKEDMIRSLLRQLCDGLKVLHDLNIVHRDLKPQNLLLDRIDSSNANDGNANGSGNENGSGLANFRLKIGDFGLARFIQPQDMAATLCGSPLYMAPEILRYQSYDARADLWSLGVILYEMVYGRLPYTGANHIQLAENIQKTTPSFPSTVQLSLPSTSSASSASSLLRGSGGGGVVVSVNPDCIHLIASLLKKKPSDRLSFEGLLSHPFLQTDPSTNMNMNMNQATTINISGTSNTESVRINNISSGLGLANISGSDILMSGSNVPSNNDALNVPAGSVAPALRKSSNSFTPPSIPSTSALSTSLNARRQQQQSPLQQQQQQQYTSNSYDRGISTHSQQQSYHQQHHSLVYNPEYPDSSPPVNLSPLNPSFTPPSPSLPPLTAPSSGSMHSMHIHMHTPPNNYSPLSNSHFNPNANANAIPHNYNYNNRSYDYPTTMGSVPLTPARNSSHLRLSPSPPLNPMNPVSSDTTSRSLATSNNSASPSNNNVASFEKEYVLVDQHLATSSPSSNNNAKSNSGVLSTPYSDEKSLHIQVPISEAHSSATSFSSRMTINIATTPSNYYSNTALPPSLSLDAPGNNNNHNTSANTTPTNPKRTQQLNLSHYMNILGVSDLYALISSSNQNNMEDNILTSLIGIGHRAFMFGQCADRFAKAYTQMDSKDVHLLSISSMSSSSSAVQASLCLYVKSLRYFQCCKLLLLHFIETRGMQAPGLPRKSPPSPSIAVVSTPINSYSNTQQSASSASSYRHASPQYISPHPFQQAVDELFQWLNDAITVYSAHARSMKRIYLGTLAPPSADTLFSHAHPHTNANVDRSDTETYMIRNEQVPGSISAADANDLHNFTKYHHTKTVTTKTYSIGANEQNQQPTLPSGDFSEFNVSISGHPNPNTNTRGPTHMHTPTPPPIKFSPPSGNLKLEYEIHLGTSPSTSPSIFGSIASSLQQQFYQQEKQELASSSVECAEWLLSNWAIDCTRQAAVNELIAHPKLASQQYQLASAILDTLRQEINKRSKSDLELLSHWQSVVQQRVDILDELLGMGKAVSPMKY